MTLVTPIKPFRAWQYLKDSTEPVPEWAKGSVPIARESDLMNTWWLVEVDGAIRLRNWYTPAEFQERFTTTDPLLAAAKETLRILMWEFPDSRAVDDHLVALALAVHNAERFRAESQQTQSVRGKFKATCCKCGRIDWRDEPVAGVYFCSYACT